MEIFGTDYNFMLTVDAMCAIAEACPGHDINRLDEWIGESVVSVAEALKVMAPAMSRAYHNVMKELDPTYDGKILSPRLIDLMTMDQVMELMAEIRKAYAIDSKPSVETKAKKKGKAAGST